MFALWVIAKVAVTGSPTNGVEYVPVDEQKPLHTLVNGEFRIVPLTDLILRPNTLVAILVEGLLMVTFRETIVIPFGLKLLFKVNISV
jgi:hypothetical protein